MERETSRRLAILGTRLETLDWRVLMMLGLLERLLRGAFGTGSLVDVQLSPGSSAWFPYEDTGRRSLGLVLALMDRLWFEWEVLGRP